MSASNSNFTEWKVGIEKFKLRTQAQTVALIKKIVFEIYARTLKKTPVDKGFLRGAWTLSIGEPSDANKGKKTGGKRSLDGNETGHYMKALAGLTELRSLVIVWLSNAMPYVNTIEFGGFPKNPKSGKGKTVDGFSKQAPKGMLGLSILEVVNWIKQQANKISPPTGTSTE